MKLSSQMTPAHALARGIASLAICALAALLPATAFAEPDLMGEDIDIFLTNPSIPSQVPNVLVVLDNTSNWSRQSQQWPAMNDATCLAAGMTGNQQGDAETCALYKVVANLRRSINVGLMMFNDQDKGGYVRFPIKAMGSTNRTAFRTLLAGIGTNKPAEKTAANSTYGNVMNDAFRYFNSMDTFGGSGAAETLADNTGYTSSAKTKFSFPSAILPTNTCGYDYIIFIGNGFPNADKNYVTDLGNAATLLSDSSNVTVKTTPLQATGSQADLWSQFMYEYGTKIGNGVYRHITTYTLDVCNAQCQTDQATLLQSMANASFGRYFKATNLQAVEDALNSIFAQIQSVNSVFAAATLPVSINVRGTNLNQVYIGVFRPDSNLSPRWVGNLKQYQLGLKTGTTDTLELKDATGASALNLNTGFVANTAKSFWTATSTFWSFQSPYTAGNVGKDSDSVDGDIVEKGGAAQQIRTVYASPDSTTAMTRKIYTCTGNCLSAAVGATAKNLTQTTDFTTRFLSSNTNITSTMLGTYATSNITSLTATGTTATVTTGTAHGFVAGDVVTIAGAVPTLYTGNFTVLASPAPTSTTFAYTLTSTPDTANAYVTYVGYPLNTATDFITVSNAAAPYNVTDAAITAVVGNASQFRYTMNSASTSAATGYTIGAKRRISAGNLTWASSTETATVLLTNHGYSTLDNVLLSGITDPTSGNPASTTLNGTFSVTKVDTNTFTYNVTGTPAGGTTTTASVVGTAPTGFTWSNGDTAIVTGASGNFDTVAAGSSVTGVSGNNFTYTTTSTVTGTATGTITAKRSVASDVVSRSITGTPTALGGSTKQRIKFIYGAGTAATTGQSTFNAIAIGDKIAIKGLTCSNTSGKTVTSVSCSSTTQTTCSAVAASEYSFTVATTPTPGSVLTYDAPADVDAVSASSALVCWKGQTLSASVSLTTVTAGSATVTGGGTMYAFRAGDLNVSGRVTSITSQGVATGTITAGIATNADANERDNLINWVRGMDNKDNENKNNVATDVRAGVHGDVLHSRPAVVNYNRTAGSNDDVYVFYGSNDGMLHAAKGGQATGGGEEQWAFIPTEFYNRFKRQRNQNPPLASTSTRDYFFDGPMAAYTKDATSNFSLGDSGDEVKLFLGLRRGGRMLYAMDVTDPTAPKFLWKKGCTVTATGAAATGYETAGTTTCDAGYAEMGQTWSEPKLGYLNAYGNARLVIIVGAGYDAPVEDLQPCGISAWNTTTVTGLTNVVFTNPLTATNCPPSGGTSTPRTRSMGRGVYIIDAANGDVLWRAVSSIADGGTALAAGTTSCAAATGIARNCRVGGMDWSVSADITVIRKRSNLAGRGASGTESVPTGYLDRIYAADVGGNLWRIDVSDADTANWVVNKVASIAPASGTTRTNMRKFTFAPDVVYSAESNGTTLYDAVMIGSGDREHPFDQLVTNRFYMFKDFNTGTIGSSTTVTAIAETDLFDATSNCLSTCTDAALTAAQSSLASSKGWYMTLSNAGEKVIAPATTAAGAVIFNTNQPKQDTITGTAVNVGPNATGNYCVSDLGTARQYGLNFKDATGANLYASQPTQNRSSDGRSATFAGGGFLPQPVPVVVSIDGKFYQTVISGVQTTNPGGLSLQSRVRTYWYKRSD